MNTPQMRPEKRQSKKTIYILVATVAGLCLLYMGVKWLTEWRFIVSTDDAYVQGDIASISPKVSGYVKKLAITANSAVKKDDPLFYIDDKDYKIAFEQAEAKLKTQNRMLHRIDTQIEAAQSTLDQAKANKDSTLAVKTNADLTLKRVKELNSNNYVSRSQLDNAKSSVKQANAAVQGAQAQIEAAVANIETLKAQREEAASETKSLELMREKAKNDLDATVINAPFDGVIANLSAKTGDLVSAGQRLAALVPLQKLYIDANYKETQLGAIKIGQKAKITIDALKGQSFEGTVVSIAPATGAVFSLLPPQNATGNFTKIVQRIAVRIALPENALKTGKILAGMSAKVEIDTSTTPDKI